MVIALAGRRIDPVDAPNAAFPLEEAPAVRSKLRALFLAQSAAALVCSAACGADLLALDIAAELGIRRRVVLPFEPARFRQTSVIDRPGNWAPIYDRVIAEAQTQSDVLIVDQHLDEDAAYAVVNTVILDEAISIAVALNESPLAVVVWEGAAREDADLTRAFSIAARTRRIPVVELTTL